MRISLGYIFGDDNAFFKEVFGFYYSPLCLYARRYINDTATCEDIVQEAFARIWAKKEKIVITGSIKNYLTSVVRNMCIDYIRRNFADRKYRDSLIHLYKACEDSPDEVYSVAELEKMIDRVMDRLPDKYRRVFDMSRYEGKSYDEISKILNISVRSAKRYKSYAEELLKEELKKASK